MKPKRLLILTLCLTMILGGALISCRGGTHNTDTTDQGTDSATSPSETESIGSEEGTEEDTKKEEEIVEPILTGP